MYRNAIFRYYIVVFFSLLVCGRMIRKKREVCDTEECQQVSEYILSKMDTSVDPCQDMYQFSCGRWPDLSQLSWGTAFHSLITEIDDNIDKQLFLLLEEEGSTFRCKDSTAIKKLKDYYRSCVNTEAIQQKGVEPLKELIDSFGSWTVSETNHPWNEDNWNLQEALTNAHKLWGKSFWIYDVDQDQKNRSRNIFKFQQGGVTLWHSAEYYENPALQKTYIQSAITVGKLLGSEEKHVEDKMSNVLDLERKLAKIYVPKETAKNPVKSYNLMKLGEFQEMLGTWIDMEKYMEGLFGGRVMTLDDEVLVTTPDYFTKLGKIVEETSKETLANYVMWNLIYDTLGYLPEQFHSAIMKFSDDEEIQQIAENQQNTEYTYGDSETNEQNMVLISNSRQHMCISRAKASLPFLTSALFVDKYLPQETINQIIYAIDNIEHQFIQRLHEIKWLDEKTRKTLIDKAESMTNQVGYPEWIMNPEKLDAKYETLVIDENEFLQNLIHITVFDKENQLNSYLKRPERKKWRQYPQTVNAYYSSFDNEMVVLAGLLQSPFITPYYPKAFVYGGVGTIIGHELIHGFDTSGRLYNKDGILGDTWTSHVAEEFNKRAQCFVDQYSSYSLFNISLNGRLSIGENIADNGGMKIAFRAYQSSINPHDFSLPGLDFTDDQLFFLGMSQFWCAYYSPTMAAVTLQQGTHAHNRFRVIGTLANSKEFAEAFQCDRNTSMNPEKKCELW